MMSLTSHVPDLSPVSWLAIFAVFSILVHNVFFCVAEEIKIRRHGGRAPRFQSWIPSEFVAGLVFLWGITRHALRDDNIKFLHNCFHRARQTRKHPLTFEVSMLGRRTLFTADPGNIKTMLAAQFDSFGKGQRFRADWFDLMGNSIFNVDGHAWHESRQRLRPLFTRQRVSNLECFERHVQQLLPFLNEGQTVDMKDLLSRFALDCSADFSLGRQVDSLTCRNDDFFEAFERIRRTQSLIERLGPLNFLIPRSQFRRDLDTIDMFMRPTIEHAISMPQVELEELGKADRDWTFVHACAAISRDPKFLRDELMTVLIAGRDTISTTLTFVFYELAKNPQVLADLRREIEETVGIHASARIPTYEDLKRMRFLSNILSETLRLYPNAPFNIRTALKDTSLPCGGGLDGSGPIGLGEGTQVIYSTHLLHLTPELYPPNSPDFPPPDELSPNRWRSWTPQPWTYIPFNGGPRICIGQQLALTEMSYLLVRVFQRFSRVELQMEKQTFHSTGWSRIGDAPELAERFITSRLQMASEITLSPRGKVSLAFFH
ncbi:cytochrome P450 [Plenodomus tracheiphilus IPT5]|uniref:Cytochrome P450 n=1 Tax=Plenodomus tracheiphilus IPT5 TaxID=1408161 RepID=A0A6A7AQZ5_9PLEO|nr:cytochrome P450 [Plenodomus tracheiphilus IPT5]